MMPHWLDLKYFLTVCESKNITRAAELLGISQPSLSLAIKRLENVAQVNLFIRTKTGVDLTREGIAFKTRSEELMELWQSISEDVKRKSDEISGRYTIGAHVSVALTSLISVVSELMTKHRELELSLTHGWSRVITDQVIGFDIDFAMVVNPTPHPDLVISEICRDEVSFYVRESGFDRDVLIYDPNLLQSQSLLNSIKSLGLRFKRTITSSSLEFIARLTRAGIGVGLLPSRVVNNLESHQITPWSEGLPIFHDKHCLIYRADAQQTKSARMLAADLKKLLIASVKT